MPKRYFRLCSSALFSIFILSVATLALAADPPRVLPAGRLPDDSRLGPLKTYNDYFPFTPSAASVEAWQTAGRLCAAADSRCHRTLADADQDT